MSLKETLAQLKALGDEKMRAQNTKNGAGDNQYGVRLGEIRKLAKQIKTNHELAMALWETGNIDARLLATLLIKKKTLTASEMNRMVQSVGFVQVADWLNAYVVKQHPDKEALRNKWMSAKDPMSARAGWNLTAERIAKSPDGLDIPGLLDRIESEMGSAKPLVQWTMNCCLAEIGIHFPKHRKRAIAIGEKLARIIHETAHQYSQTLGFASLSAPDGTLQILASSTTRPGRLRGQHSQSTVSHRVGSSGAQSHE